MSEIKERTEAECFEILYERIRGLNISEIYTKVKQIFLNFTKEEAPVLMSEVCKDRDYLEVSIVMLDFIHCLVYEIDFETFKDNVKEFKKIESKNKALWYLIKLKAEIFGKEILKENGLELVGVVGENYVVVDEKIITRRN